jgi:hypothetical protein
LKKLFPFITILALVISLSGCALLNHGPDKKIFIDDINSAVSKVKNPNSAEAKRAINALYATLTSDCNDLNNKQKSFLKDTSKQIYISLFKNLKCSNITVNVTAKTANVESTITVNNISEMKNDLQSEMKKLSSSVRNMSKADLRTFFGGKDVSTMSQSQITYVIIAKGLASTLTEFKSKNYAENSKLKLVYTQSGDVWNITNDSQKRLDALLDPEN